MKKKETKSLKARLIQKFQTVDAERADAEAKAAAWTNRETEERFIAFFGQKPERVDGMKAFFEDVAVQRNCGSQGGWQVIQNCPVCKKEIVSSASVKTEDIGRSLAVSPKHYQCGSTPVRQTTEDKLLDALREFISENTIFD